MISRRSYRIANDAEAHKSVYQGKISHRTPKAAARKRLQRRARVVVQTLVFVMGIALVFGTDITSLLNEATTTHAATLQAPATTIPTIPEEPLTLE